MGKRDMYNIGYRDGVTDVMDDICQTLFEGEDTEIGRKITIERIKEYAGYKSWLSNML